jgi:hypothetical protein
VGVGNSQHARLQAVAQARFANADCTSKKESQFVERRLPADGIVAAIKKTRHGPASSSRIEATTLDGECGR